MEKLQALETYLVKVTGMFGYFDPEKKTFKEDAGE